MKVNVSGLCFLVFCLLSTGCATVGGAGRTDVMTRVADGVCRDPHSGLEWQVARSKLIRDIDGARQYAAELRLGGHDDWRLPTIYELYDLSYMVDLHKKGECDFNIEGNFWSDKKDGDGMVGAWEISDQCEPERQYFSKTKGYVRGVRP